jgi:hypothetical protein
MRTIDNSGFFVKSCSLILLKNGAAADFKIVQALSESPLSGPKYSNERKSGKHFPFVRLAGCTGLRNNLTEIPGPIALLGTGCNSDGWLAHGLYAHWMNPTPTTLAKERPRSRADALDDERYPGGLFQ